jgi:hypothetical protein
VKLLLYGHFFVLFGTMERLELSEIMMVCLYHVCLAFERDILAIVAKSRRRP